MTIYSKIPTSEYKDNWERIFRGNPNGNKKEEEIKQEETDEEKVRESVAGFLLDK